MKKTILLFLFLSTIIFSQEQTGTFTVSPSTFEENEEITITVSGVNPAIWGVSDVYLWAWSFNQSDLDQTPTNAVDSPTNGSWTSSNEAQKMTNNGNGNYSFTFIPSTFYARTGLKQIGMLVKAKNGTGDKKTQDQLFNVGKFQLTLNSPTETITLLNSGETLAISASTSLAADYTLKANGTSINTATNSTTYSFTPTITENTIFVLEATNVGTIESETFNVVVPSFVEEEIPAGLVDGINYSDDPTKATLVLTAPGKEYIEVAGSFNNYQPTSDFGMKKDPNSDKFWLELTDLVSNQIETYQYWVYDTTPNTNSPRIVKTADPFSPLLLSPFDDPGISEETYPNMPAYPAGQEREVTVLQTGQAPYDWQVTDFQKPKKEDLIVYEVLIRDFDTNRNYQDLIDKIDYFKNLNINAIELMPVMEFDGNETWGYNTGFHYALDKFYGSQDKFKEFVDVCHQNGIAVILDIALNHATGRNPLVRMWMDDADNNGWGEPSSDNPYFNTVAKHSYSVFSDFNHQSNLTQEYSKRVIKHWIEEYNIDGFRWDLTKGFTQNCSGSDEGCTNSYQQDRVDVLKSYADYSWSIDANHYVIFEHLGANAEEQQWANYKDGIMMWGKLTDPYNELTMATSGSKNFSGMGHKSRGFNQPRLLGYAESHDEERLMYKNITFGNNSTASHNVRELNTALSRMSALGAVTLTIPGPKMIWHFGDLGMDISIFTCTNGSINNDGCKLDTKNQPQWQENWLTNANRKIIYDDWSRINLLKTSLPVFEGDYTITSGSLTPRIDIFETSIPETDLRNVIILANFDVVAQTVNTNFPLAGAWVDLMDPSGNTTYAASTVTLQPGEFRIFGNQQATLSTDDNTIESSLRIYPNPATQSFSISKDVKDLKIYDITGKKVKQFSKSTIINKVFSVTDLNTGIYFVRIKNDSNKMITKKLIIN